MEMLTHLLRRSESPSLTGPLNEVVAENAALGHYALWFSENLTNQAGLPYTTANAAIRHGLPQATVPFVNVWFAGLENPADRARVAEGTHVLSTYHRDHTGQIVNPMLEHAYKNRLSTVSLTVGLREVCGCDIEGCFIHPVEGTGGGERVMGGGVGTRRGGCVGYPTGIYVENGAVATQYGNKYNSGITKGDGSPTFKTGILGMVGPDRVGVVAWRTCSKRAGMGKKGERDPSLIQYRYATSCNLCGKKTCWGCKDDSHLRWTTVQTPKGRAHFALDPRGEAQGFGSVATVRAALEAQEGVAAVIVGEQPFESGWVEGGGC